MEYWEQMEKGLARKLKGMLTPGSGNKQIKGDVHTSKFVVEAKWRNGVYNDRRYLTLDTKWLSTIVKQAEMYDKEPMLAICIANLSTYYLVRREFWEESQGKMEHMQVHEHDLSDVKQLRMYADNNYAYNSLTFSEVGEWILLPEEDLVFLVRLATIGEEPWKGKQPQRRPKSQSQLDREQTIKDRDKQRRKDLYQQRKAAKRASS